MTVIRTELETKMLRRMRKHMITSFAGILGAVVAITGIAYGARAANLPKAVAGVAVALAILAIPAVGFWSTWKNLRCPACERGVAFQVSANVSLLGASASKKCRHCGAKIFPDDTARRMLVFMLIAFAVGGLLGVVRLFLGR